MSYRGIKGITMVSHGQNDPELFYKSIRADYYDLEDYLWDVYKERCEESGTTPSDDGFDTWVRDHASIAYDWFEDYKVSCRIGDYHGIEGVAMYDYSFTAPSREDTANGILYEGTDDSGKSRYRDYSNVQVECNGVSEDYFDVEEWLAPQCGTSDGYNYRHDAGALDAFAKANPDIVKFYFQKEETK